MNTKDVETRYNCTFLEFMWKDRKQIPKKFSMYYNVVEISAGYRRNTSLRRNLRMYFFDLYGRYLTVTVVEGRNGMQEICQALCTSNAGRKKQTA